MDDSDQNAAGKSTLVTLPDRRGGGTGLAGGTDLHAMSLVVAAVALMRGVPLSWLEGVADDVPVAIRAETGWAGDDIGIDLADGLIIEVQVKKGLGAGPKLWEALKAPGGRRLWGASDLRRSPTLTGWQCDRSRRAGRRRRQARRRPARSAERATAIGSATKQLNERM